jgi:AcrR family transcriptional regulator
LGERPRRYRIIQRAFNSASEDGYLHVVPASSKRTAGRPRLGGRDTRADILQAARALFADLGFERTTMRAVAARAEVDVALIYHHFASKDDLLTAALTVPERARPNLVAIPAGTRDPGRAVASAIIGMWEHDPALRAQALAMIRTALSHEHAAQRLQAVHSTAVLALVAEIVADDQRELRAALIGAHLSGLLQARHLFKVHALAAADPDLIIAAAAPVIEHFLTGDLAERPPDDRRERALPQV